MTIFIVGYPGNPGTSGNALSLLEQLFKSTFGCKRVAPGLVTRATTSMPKSPRHWTVGHDATTLAGNSGSVVLVLGRANYGGRSSEPRENWCHVLGLTLNETDRKSEMSLRDRLEQAGVRLVDRFSEDDA